jgi:hypothetical protein
MRAVLIAGLSLSFALPALGNDAQSERWEYLWEQQALQTATWAGASYERRLIVTHNTFWPAIHAKCGAPARLAGVQAFKAVAVIDANGEVSEFVVFSKDKALRCFVEEMVGKKYPAPPFAPFHEGFQMTVREPNNP